MNVRGNEGWKKEVKGLLALDLQMKLKQYVLYYYWSLYHEFHSLGKKKIRSLNCNNNSKSPVDHLATVSTHTNPSPT